MSNGERAADLRLVRARHNVVNSLLRYLRAVDDHDMDGVLAELRDARVDFGGAELHGVEELTEAYRAAFAAGGRTYHLLHEVEVEVAVHGPGVVGRAAYQRWSLDADPPVLTALGRYHAVFITEGRELRLLRLTVGRNWQRRS
ncbi:nuclear transport factor 2 family protein [Streptomyces sp. NPDC090088]|uniref:nuclear transport factor 2 family protein n=1 Tax=Streptomyces sp. NPDC090088 TaxID=3365944 RepID=UPI00381A349F